MDIREKIKNLPTKPGCYLYLNNDDQVIYVGKAKNLKNRVSQYFVKSQNVKTTRLVREIVKFDYFVVNNEKEALILEENLIKKYRPKYNVLLNDDKAYPYIIITNELNPEYKYVRKFDKKALKSYGPLPLGTNAKNVLTTLQRIFPLRRCKGNLGHPCLHYQINQCSGACFKIVDQEYYVNQIKQIEEFFSGHSETIRNQLIFQMEMSANNLQFEQAQRTKEIIAGLNLLLEKQTVEFSNLNNFDIVTYQIKEDKIYFMTLFYRAGNLVFKDEFVNNFSFQDESDLFCSYLEQIYTKNIIPKKIIIPVEITLTKSMVSPEVLKAITHPINLAEKSLFTLASTNLEELIKKEINNLVINKNNKLPLLVQLQDKANLKKLPLHLEMFDVSNIANEIVIGSCVVYKNGIPIRNEFRKYNIAITQKDDAHRMGEMVFRRYQKMMSENKLMPDLIIVDGGIIQKQMIESILFDLDLKIDVIGLIKDEHHKTKKILTSDNEVLLFTQVDRSLYNFLAEIQIRVDQYAKSSLHQKQTNSMLYNSLLEVKGIGKKKLQELLKEFSNTEHLKGADFETLNKIINNNQTTMNLIAFIKENKI